MYLFYNEVKDDTIHYEINSIPLYCIGYSEIAYTIMQDTDSLISKPVVSRRYVIILRMRYWVIMMMLLSTFYSCCSFLSNVLCY